MVSHAAAHRCFPRWMWTIWRPPAAPPPSASPTLSPFKLAARKRLSWANQGYNALPPAGSPGTPRTPVEGAPDSPGSHEGRPSDVEVGLDEAIA